MTTHHHAAQRDAEAGTCVECAPSTALAAIVDDEALPYSRRLKALDELDRRAGRA